MVKSSNLIIRLHEVELMARRNGHSGKIDVVRQR